MSKDPQRSARSDDGWALVWEPCVCLSLGGVYDSNRQPRVARVHVHVNCDDVVINMLVHPCCTALQVPSAVRIWKA